MAKKPVQDDRNRPDFIARARQAPGSEYYTTVGAAWMKQDKNGKTFYSVKLNTMPVGFDGSFILVEPLPENG